MKNDNKNISCNKVPVVATINQRVDESGLVHMDIEAPEDEDDSAEITPEGNQEQEVIDSLVMTPEIASLGDVVQSSQESEEQSVTQELVMNTSVVRP